MRRLDLSEVVVRRCQELLTQSNLTETDLGLNTVMERCLTGLKVRLKHRLKR